MHRSMTGRGPSPVFVAAVALVAATMAPHAALAAAHTDTDEVPTDEATTMSQTSDNDGPDGDDPGGLVARASSADQPPADTSAVCDDPLVTYTPDGADGDLHAVALTSQALEADTPGWLHVSWEAAAGITVETVVVEHSDGAETLTGADLASGTVEDVLAITFCGHDEPDQPDTVTPPDDEVEVQALVLTAPPTTSDPDATHATDGTAVLGASLARTGTTEGWLTIAGLAALLAGTGMLRATRQRSAVA